MLNTALVTGREEVKFSTVDMCVFDLYNGKCTFTKAGAALSFIKSSEGVTSIKSTSLPIGVISDLHIDETESQLKDGDYIIMITDGVMDALPVGEQEVLLKMMIEGNTKTNPKEMAEHLLGQVLECSGEIPMDDMTILVVGLCSLEK
jgi:stage II sporulation protein E